MTATTLVIHCAADVILLLEATTNEPIGAHTDTFLALRFLMDLVTDKEWTVSPNRSGVVARKCQTSDVEHGKLRLR